MRDLFDKHGGFRRIHTFTLATIIQLETGRFCRRFLTHDHREAGVKLYDPKGRQYDQMVQAARSGRQNIIEGSERASASKDTEMKLTDVARTSLSELRGDFEIFILDRGELPWSCHAPEAMAVNAVSLDAPTFTGDVVHESARHTRAVRPRSALSAACRCGCGGPPTASSGAARASRHAGECCPRGRLGWWSGDAAGPR